MIPNLRPSKAPAERLGHQLFAAFGALMEHPDNQDLPWAEVLGAVEWLRTCVQMRLAESQGFVIVKGNASDN